MNVFLNKIARIAAGSAALGAAAALIFVGAPADAEVLAAARNWALSARGV